MEKISSKRWDRWNVLIMKKKYLQLIKEFDKMVHNREKVTFGDLILRDQALEFIGVASLSPNAIYNRKYGNERFGKGKPKA